MDNSQEFKQAASLVKKLVTQPDNDIIGQLYGLYKQATIGDINITKPSQLDFINYSKWEAWNKYKGLDKYSSEVSYVYG